MEAISNYLNKILVYDWNNFNRISDMLKQLNKWNKLFDEFDETLIANKDFVLANFDEVQREIISRQPQFSSLNIKGKIHGTVNSFFIKGNLIQKTNNFKFKNIMKADSCNCLIRKELQQNPDYNKLNFIVKGYDGYYYSDIYKCCECNEKWVLEFLDDGSSRWER